MPARSPRATSVRKEYCAAYGLADIDFRYPLVEAAIRSTEPRRRIRALSSGGNSSRTAMAAWITPTRCRSTSVKAGDVVSQTDWCDPAGLTRCLTEPPSRTSQCVAATSDHVLAGTDADRGGSQDGMLCGRRSDSAAAGGDRRPGARRIRATASGLQKGHQRCSIGPRRWRGCYI